MTRLPYEHENHPSLDFTNYTRGADLNGWHTAVCSCGRPFYLCRIGDDPTVDRCNNCSEKFPNFRDEAHFASWVAQGIRPRRLFRHPTTDDMLDYLRMRRLQKGHLSFGTFDVDYQQEQAPIERDHVGIMPRRGWWQRILAALPALNPFT